MKELAVEGEVMYNITHVRRPTHRRPQAQARSRTPSASPGAHARGTREAREGRTVGSASKVSGRMGFIQLAFLRAACAAADEEGTRRLRSSLRCFRIQAKAASLNLNVETTREERTVLNCLRKRIRANGYPASVRRRRLGMRSSRRSW